MRCICLEKVIRWWNYFTVNRNVLGMKLGLGKRVLYSLCAWPALLVCGELARLSRKDSGLRDVFEVGTFVAVAGCLYGITIGTIYLPQASKHPGLLRGTIIHAVLWVLVIGFIVLAP